MNCNEKLHLILESLLGVKGLIAVWIKQSVNIILYDWYINCFHLLFDKNKLNYFKFFLDLNNCNKVYFESIVFFLIYRILYQDCFRQVCENASCETNLPQIEIKEKKKQSQKFKLLISDSIGHYNVFLFNAVAGVTGVVMTLSLILMISSATELIRFAFD